MRRSAVDWQVRTIGDLVTHQTAGVDPSDVDGLSYVGLEHIDTGEMSVDRWGDPATVRSRKTRFESGDILYGKLRPYLDKAALVAQPGICSTDILVLSPKQGVDSYFAAALLHLKSFVAHAVATTTGVNHPRTSWNAIRQFEVACPPISEQRAIAHVLRTVQRAKEVTEQVIAAAQELKKSLMRHLFTYGPVPMDHVESVSIKETAFGAIPSSWDLRSLGEVIDIQRGQVDPRVEPYASMVHVGPDNIEAGTGRLQAHQTARDLGLISGKYLFDPDWVLYSKIRPYLRKAAQPQFEGVCSADMYPLRPSVRELRQDFLFRYLLSDGFTRQATSHQSRTGIPKINRLQLSGVPIPLPDGASQEAISHTLAQVDAKIAAEEAGRDALATLFDSLLHDLMTARLRVIDLIPEVA